MGPDNEILLDQSLLLSSSSTSLNNIDNGEISDESIEKNIEENNIDLHLDYNHYNNYNNVDLCRKHVDYNRYQIHPNRINNDDNIMKSSSTIKMNGHQINGCHNHIITHNHSNGIHNNGQKNKLLNGFHKNESSNGYCHFDDSRLLSMNNGYISSNNKIIHDNYHHANNSNHCPKIPEKSSKLSYSTNGIEKNGYIKATSAANHFMAKSESVKSNQKKSTNHFERAPYHIAFLCYVNYAVLIIFGYIRDFMRKTGLEKNLCVVERDREGYTPLYKSFESFYTRNIYRRIRDAWNRPIASVPGAEIDIIDRHSNDYNWTFEYPGTKSRLINMGSYNYLGYAENSGPIHEKILETINENGVSICSTRNEFGHNEHVEQLERLMAKFLGVESCVVFGMGFATNSTNIQCFIGPECLIMSDSHNHASLILGCRLSGATIRVFKHNNMIDLERKIQKSIIDGQPKTGKSWKKIVIIVEGIYSMEGTIVNLPELIRIKKQYKCYIYLDEAHSIGALGPNARGVIDYYGCDPNDVDILMGTFTKSFGAAGGYIAGSQKLIDLIRINSFSHYYANPMSSPIAMQIICVIKSLLGENKCHDGRKRIRKLAYNTRYFRKKLRQMGFIIYGHDDSPVVPLLLCFCAKIACVLRLASEKGLGFIGAGYPATSLTTGRVRFCISAAHTKEMLDRSLDVMNEIGDKIGIKYSSEKFTYEEEDEDEEEYDDDGDHNDY